MRAIELFFREFGGLRYFWVTVDSFGFLMISEKIFCKRGVNKTSFGIIGGWFGWEVLKRGLS